MSQTQAHPGSGTLGLRDLVLEREGEAAAIEEAMDAALAGRGRLLVVEGAPGIGKSRLLAMARDRGREAGLMVLSAAGHEHEREFAFGVALRLLEPSLAAAPDEVRSLLFSGRAATARSLFEGTLSSDPDRGADHGFALVHALRELTLNLGRADTGPSPTLLTVDDAHLSDDSSLRFLAHLSADIADLPVVVLMATRSTRDARGGPLTGLAAGARVLRLHPLTLDAIDTFVRAAYPDATGEFVHACADATGGNPFFLRELIGSALAGGIAATPEGARELATLVPESVLRSVLLRIAGLPGDARAVAAATAVLGDGTPLRRAAALAGIDLRRAAQAADALAEAQILCPGEPLRFVHPLVRAAVAEDLAPLARAGSHKRAAELLMAEGAPVEAAAAHLLLAPPAYDDGAAAVLREAASRAGARGESAAARRLLERALAEPPPPAERDDVLVDLALAEAATGAPGALEILQEALGTATDPPRRLEALRALARIQFARSDFAAAAAAAERAVEEGDPADPAATDLLVDTLTIVGVSVAPEPRALTRIADLLERQARGELPREPRMRALLSYWMLSAGRPAAKVAEVARTSLAGLPADDGFYGFAAGGAVLALIGAGDLDPAEAAIERALEWAGRAGSVIGMASASHWRAVLRLQRGDLDGAIADSRQMLDVGRTGFDVCAGWVAPVLAEAQLERGDLDAAGAAIDDAKRWAGGRPELALALVAEGRVQLAGGDPERALATLLAAGAHGERSGLAHATVLPWRAWASVAAGRAGDLSQAAELARVDLAEARAVGADRTIGVALRASGLAEDGERALALLADSVAALGGTAATLEHARSLLELGTALHRGGERVASREPLREALELALRAGARPLAAAAHQELRAAGGRRRAAGGNGADHSLTGTERRVAELAARGLPTPQIARTLYVSPKTVSWHLGHAYRKLGINSRSQLSEALAARETA